MTEKFDNGKEKGMTKCYYRGSDIGSDKLKESILAQSERFTLDDADKILGETCLDVNEKLSGSFTWLPYVSEIHCAITETEELDMDDFWNIVNAACEENCDKYFAEHYGGGK